MGDDSDPGGCESDSKDNEAGDRSPIVLQISKRRVVSCIQEDRGDEKRQRKLRKEGERRRAWNKREQRSAEREEHGIRCSHAARHGSEDHSRDK